MQKGILFIISSPSGGGKGTLIRELLRSAEGIGYSVSYTTRPMREGEVDGKDYSFVSRERFEELIDGGEFLEYANVHGNYYGTSLKRVEEETFRGRDIVLEIDVQGAEEVKEKVPDVVSIFILPPSFETLRDRLIARNTESDTVLHLRLRNAAGEVARYKEFDYVIVNDVLERAVADLKSVVLAERCRQNRRRDNISAILESFNTGDN